LNRIHNHNGSNTLSSVPYEITLSAIHLKRCFGGQTVIRDISLELQRGEVMGLLGHNGTGKSTTLQMLTGCLQPDSGEIKICGIDLSQHPIMAKAHIGYLPETPPLYRELNVDEYLTYTARLRGIDNASTTEALVLAKQRCGLSAVGQKNIGTLSKGYQQRVGIAQAIIHQPDVIVLDEPTVGLDPAQIRDVRSLIRELGDTHSVILSTHLLSEVESLCDRVAILHEGELVFNGTTAELDDRDGKSGNLEENFIRLTEQNAAKESL